MAYSSMSTKISNYLAKESNCSEEQKAVLAYGMESIILTAVVFIVVIFTGFLLGAWKETLLAALAGGVLRKMSGGAHMATPAQCLIVSTVCYSAAGLLASKLYFWAALGTVQALFTVLAVFTIFMVLRYAPMDSKAKPIVSASFRKKLHLASIVTLLFFLAVAWTSLHSVTGIALLLGLTTQAATLLPVLNDPSERG